MIQKDSEIELGGNILKIVGRRTNGEFLALCENPKCKDTKGHLSINLNKKMVYCFKCGYKRALAYSEITELSDNRNPYHTAIPYLSQEKKPKEESGNTKSFVRLVRNMAGTLPGKVLTYALNRGLIPELLPLYYSTDYPFYLIYKTDTWWQGRAIDGRLPKNLFPRDLPLGAYFEYSENKEINQVVICEGIFDAWSCRKKGRLVIALLGSTLKKQQLFAFCNRFREFTGDIIIFLDADANEKAWKIKNTLKEKTFNTIKKVTWPDSVQEGDPDSISPELREDLIAKAY